MLLKLVQLLACVYHILQIQQAGSQLYLAAEGRILRVGRHHPGAISRVFQLVGGVGCGEAGEGVGAANDGLP